MIAYSEQAQLARAYLQRTYNAFDVFVEDASCQNMWVRLINTFLEGRATISAVFPLGNRRSVIERCANAQPSERRQLFIIDGDLDELAELAVPSLPDLIRLKVYCAENLLFFEPAFVEVASEGLTSATREEVAKKLCYKELLERVTEVLLPLFVIYAIVYKLNLPVATVRYPVARLCADANDPWSLSRPLVRRRIRQVLREAGEFATREDLRAARRQITAELRRRHKSFERLISGKDYLLPLFHAHLRKISGLRDSSAGLKVRLAQHATLDIEPELVRAVQARAA